MVLKSSWANGELHVQTPVFNPNTHKEFQNRLWVYVHIYHVAQIHKVRGRDVSVWFTLIFSWICLNYQELGFHLKSYFPLVVNRLYRAKKGITLLKKKKNDWIPEWQAAIRINNLSKTYPVSCGQCLKGETNLRVQVSWADHFWLTR